MGPQAYLGWVLGPVGFRANQCPNLYTLLYRSSYIFEMFQTFKIIDQVGRPNWPWPNLTHRST